MEKYETKLKKVLEDMSYAITHLEDMVADNRKIMIKLVKQGNSIVKFLSQLDIEEGEEIEVTLPPLDSDEKEDDKITSIKELIEEYMDKFEDLKEFEEELQKHKEKITPGTIGES